MKKIRNVIRAVLTILTWSVGGYIFNKHEYFIAFNEIDNIVGMLPFAIVLTCAIGISALLWMKYAKRNALLIIVIASFVILSFALFPTALRGNWQIGTPTASSTGARASAGAQSSTGALETTDPDKLANVNSTNANALVLNMGSEAASANDISALPDELSAFVPFSPGSKTVKLTDTSTLQLSGDLPKLDGATALYPVYAAFVEAAYSESAFTPGDALCTNTQNAYKSIVAGDSDIIFVAGASERQAAAARAAGTELVFTPIGREAFVFMVGINNPVDNISIQQLRNIYSGKTARWRTLGWENGGNIIAFQRPEGSGSQTGLQTFMSGLTIQVPQPLPDASLIGSDSLMQQVSVEWKGVQPAIGYSYRYYATTMYPNPEAKLLSIEGAEPSIENIRNGSYPFVGDFYAVTNGESAGNIKLLLDWILSPQGQEIIQKTGYTPLFPTT